MIVLKVNNTQGRTSMMLHMAEELGSGKYSQGWWLPTFAERPKESGDLGLQTTMKP